MTYPEVVREISKRMDDADMKITRALIANNMALYKCLFTFS